MPVRTTRGEARRRRRTRRLSRCPTLGSNSRVPTSEASTTRRDSPHRTVQVNRLAVGSRRHLAGRAKNPRAPSPTRQDTTRKRDRRPSIDGKFPKSRKARTARRHAPTRSSSRVGRFPRTEKPSIACTFLVWTAEPSGGVPVPLPGLGSHRSALDLEGRVVFLGVVPGGPSQGPGTEQRVLPEGLLALPPRGDHLATGTSHAHGPTGRRPTSRSGLFGRRLSRTRTRVFGADRFAAMVATTHGRILAGVREQEACRLAAAFRDRLNRKRHRTSRAKTTRPA